MPKHTCTECKVFCGHHVLCSQSDFHTNANYEVHYKTHWPKLVDIEPIATDIELVLAQPFTLPQYETWLQFVGKNKDYNE